MRYLARIASENKNSGVGKIFSYLSDKLEIDYNSVMKVSPTEVKRRLQYCSISEEETWKVNAARELIYSRQKVYQSFEIPGFTSNEIQSMLDDICTS